VTTYIQSGNVVFRVDGADTKALAATLEAGMAAAKRFLGPENFRLISGRGLGVARRRVKAIFRMIFRFSGPWPFVT
jgi:hypothetical protein